MVYMPTPVPVRRLHGVNTGLSVILVLRLCMYVDFERVIDQNYYLDLR